MTMWESEPRFAVTCDHEGCYESSPEEGSERFAKATAKDEGWAEVDGKWYCPEHLKLAQRRARKAGVK